MAHNVTKLDTSVHLKGKLSYTHMRTLYRNDRLYTPACIKTAPRYLGPLLAFNNKPDQEIAKRVQATNRVFAELRTETYCNK